MKTGILRDSAVAFVAMIAVFLGMLALTLGGSLVHAQETTPDTIPYRYDGTCFEYLDDYMHVSGAPTTHDFNEVIRLQAFLIGYAGENIAFTGVYDEATRAAVARFQMAHYDEIIRPWVEAGYTFDAGADTGYLYLTTKRYINSLMCPVESIPMPPLVPDTNVANTVVL